MPGSKPPGVSRQSWLEGQIEEARGRGLFDHLPGAGRPQEDLGEADDPLWWAKALLRREQLSVLPPALELRKKVEATLARLPELRREADAREALETLNAVIRDTNAKAHRGPPSTQAPLDVEAELLRWRTAREGTER